MMATEKLISVDRYQKTLEHFKEKLIEFGKVEAAEAVKTLIKGLALEPKVDAVEVIRCKDCKFFHDKGYCTKITGLTRIKPDDFCSRGE